MIGAPILKLAGVMQGTFLDAHEVKYIDIKNVPISASNMGITAIVPGYKLYEILFSEELKRKRGY